LKKVVHSGRLEFLKENILVDGAHNIDSLKVLKNFIKQNLEYKFDQIFYCFWLKKWKNIDMVLDVFWKNENYILVDIESNALEDIKKHSNRFPLRTKEHIISESNKNKKNLYVVFGSLYMIWDFLR
jgi:folylpolyglutamate synthase/dihydropteroate synthase